MQAIRSIEGEHSPAMRAINKIHVDQSSTRRIKKNTRRAKALRGKLEEAALGRTDVLSSIAVDLADIATIGLKHQERIKRTAPSAIAPGYGKVGGPACRIPS